MTKQTSNFGFEKPYINEFYDIQVENENWDKVNEVLSEIANKLDTLIKKCSGYRIA